MPTTADELYEREIRRLPPAERLKLARRILEDFPPQALVDYREEWSDEDLRDFSAASLTYIDQRLEAEEQQDAQAG